MGGGSWEDASCFSSCQAEAICGSLANQEIPTDWSLMCVPRICSYWGSFPLSQVCLTTGPITPSFVPHMRRAPVWRKPVLFNMKLEFQIIWESRFGLDYFRLFADGMAVRTAGTTHWVTFDKRPQISHYYQLLPGYSLLLRDLWRQKKINLKYLPGFCISPTPRWPNL